MKNRRWLLFVAFVLVILGFVVIFHTKPEVGDILTFEGSRTESGQFTSKGLFYKKEGRWLHVHPIIDGKVVNENWKLTICEVDNWETPKEKLAN